MKLSMRTFVVAAAVSIGLAPMIHGVQARADVDRVAAPAVMAGDEIEATNANYKEIIARSADKPVVFVVGATWSKFTNLLYPKFQAKNKDANGAFLLARVNGDLSKEALAHFKIAAYPTVIGYSDSAEMADPARFADGSASQEKVNAFADKVVASWNAAHPKPTPTPTPTPTPKPTATPTSTPTVKPTPTASPTSTPTVAPTGSPTAKPTFEPTFNPNPNGDIVHVTDANYKESIDVVSHSKPVVAFVSATYCSWCKQLFPKIEEANKQDKGLWRVLYIDADVNPEAAKFFDAWGYPTLIAYGRGREMRYPGRVADGSMPLEKVRQFADEAIKNWKSGINDPAPKPTPKPGEGKLPELPKGAVEITSKAMFDRDVIEESKKRPVIMDFSKDLCEPCIKISPTLDKKYVADAGKWQYTRIDGTAVTEVWDMFDRPWFPSLIAFRNGKEVGRYTGYDGKEAPVIKFIDDVMAGKDPGSDPKVADIATAEDWQKIKDISWRHPVVLRIHMEKFMKGQTRQRANAEKLANADGGKWTLANVDRNAPIVRTIGSELGNQAVAGSTALHTIVYQGEARIQLEGLTKLVQGDVNEPELRAWLDKMLSHQYEDRGVKPGEAH